ncbi:PREDICTED: hemicentin-2-like [Amphimedon queenslandica]|uniref:Ig-like domain-containing protein n=1 Tax=Amphimedon queenslandica TaxID=400682 RepID=A0A1X7UCH0_AMPQE|nr:PREDICTED: hemicentin-2-like [Amphimedon queenslandica]|eukprot:XP_019855115.1 PREDICTED: hemicentin-2-like [Amphimedon queenslandica]
MQLISLSSVLLLLCLQQPANAKITFYQRHEDATSCNLTSNTCWRVEGLASYDHGGVASQTFVFICHSDQPNPSLSWSLDEGSLGKSQQSAGDDSVIMLFSNPVATDAGIYICRDSANNEEEMLNITHASPVAQAVNPLLTVVGGSPVTIEFYASAVQPIQPADIAWRLNGIELTSGLFNSWKRSLYIPSAAASDNGTYLFAVASGTGALKKTESATVDLIVITPPTIVSGPQNVSGVKEWSSISLSCTVMAGASFNISWSKLNGALPVNTNISTQSNGENTMISTLTIPNVRVIDSGSYQCSSSFTNGSNYTSSLGTLNITGSIRLMLIDTNNESSLVTSPLLYVPTSSNFNIECQGTGEFDWSGGQGGGASIASEASGSPRQFSTSTSFRSLAFESFQMADSGYYTCTSTAGEEETVFITDANPAVYSPLSTFRVNNHTNLSLIIYTDGSPLPSPSSITWYHNNMTIDNSSPYYTISEDSTVCSIMGPSEEVTGNYTVLVTTSAGTNTKHFNVTYFDPPFITVQDESVSILRGSPAVLHCNASSELDVSLSWVFEGSPLLPMNSIVSDDGHTLTVGTESLDNAGVYSCVATDGISVVSRDVRLNILYGPESVIFTCSKFNLTEGTMAATCRCSSTSYPPPTLNWIYNGTSVLPPGIGVTRTISGSLILFWTRGVVYTDEGFYTCRASNDYGSVNETNFISVNATPIIRSFYPSGSAVTISLQEATPSFGCLPNSTLSYCRVVCVARGWPAPSLYWIDQSTLTPVTNSYVVREGGVVSAVLDLADIQFGDFSCESVNKFGRTSQTVSITAVTTPPVIPPTPPLPDSTLSANMRLRLLNSNCQSSSEEEIRTEMSNTLTDATLSNCHLCSRDNETITIETSRCDFDGATVFVASLKGTSSGSFQRLYSSFTSWWSSNPLISLSGSLYLLDHNCSLLIQDGTDQFNCVEPVTASSPTPTPSSDPSTTSVIDTYQIIWIVVVAVIAALCMIVGVALFVVLCLCVRTLRRNKKEDIGESIDNSLSNLRTFSSRNAMSRSNMEMDASFAGSHSTLGGRHRGSIDDDGMLSNPEYFDRELVQQVRRESNLSESTSSQKRLLQTTPTNEIDYPSFSQSQGESYHGNDRRSSSHSEVIVSNTPIQEILYSDTTQTPPNFTPPPVFTPSTPVPQTTPPQSTPTPINVYDQIRPTATRRSISLAQKDPRHQQSSTLPLSPAHKYEEPSPPAHPRSRMRSNPSIATPYPFPYSQPVSSQRDINKAGVVSPAPLHLMQRATSVPSDQHWFHPPQRAGHPKNSIGSSSKLPAVRERGTSPPSDHWYHGNSDIVTPTNVIDYATSSISSQSLNRPISRGHSGGGVVPPVRQGVVLYEV